MLDNVSVSARAGQDWPAGRKQSLWRRLTCSINDLIFLERCRLCHGLCSRQNARHPDLISRTTTVCIDCWHSIAAQKPLLDWLRLDAAVVFKIISGARYNGALKSLVYKLKYDNDRQIANDLALLLLNAWSYAGLGLPGNSPLVLVPIPLHKSRLRARGFNQAELLAKQLGHWINVPVDLKALIRLKPTSPQHGLGRIERLSNLCGAFAGRPERLAGKAVLLVDDICTSGSTLSEAARVAFENGAEQVIGLTVARALLAKAGADD